MSVQESRIVALHRAGHNTPEISRRTGHARATVSAALRRAGQELRGLGGEWTLPPLGGAAQDYLSGYLHAARWDEHSPLTVHGPAARMRAVRGWTRYGTYGDHQRTLRLSFPERLKLVRDLAPQWDSPHYWAGRNAARGWGEGMDVLVLVHPEEWPQASAALERLGWTPREVRTRHQLRLTGDDAVAFLAWTDR